MLKQHKETFSEPHAEPHNLVRTFAGIRNTTDQAVTKTAILSNPCRVFRYY